MLCMQESTIKSNFTFMRLLCGLLLFSIILLIAVFIVAGIWNLVFHFLVGVTQFSVSLALQLLFYIPRNYFFLPLFKVIPTKLTHFRLIFQNFFSFKTWFISKFQVIEFKPRDNLEFTPWHLDWWIVRVWRSLSKSLWQHNGATNLAFEAKKN